MASTVMKASKIRKCSRAASALAACAVLASCLDVTQGISGDGTAVEVQTRVALSTAMLELGASMGGGELPEDGLGLDGTPFDPATMDLPAGVSTTSSSFETELERGYELRMVGLRKAFAEWSADFVPVIGADSILVTLPATDGADEEGFATAFLSMAKYRLVLSRKLVSALPAARIEAGGKSFPGTVYRMSEVYIVELPLVLWLASGEECRIVVEW